MNWERLLSTKRRRESRSRHAHGADLRSEFEKDYHRIIGSASFRRLQDKTQVFPLDKSDFIRTRLTHSLEVSSFAKSLGQNIGEKILAQGQDPQFTWKMKEDICNILQCAGLIHDIGNPPFGHFGEEAIRRWFKDNLPRLTYGDRPLDQVLSPRMVQDLYHFEGNAQALRLVSRLHFLVDENGMNLTYGLLSSIIKYPVSSLEVNPDSEDIREKKMGYYLADEELFWDIVRETGTDGARHPLVYILEAADDIAYKTADIEDAFVKGFIGFEKLVEVLEDLENKESSDARGFQGAEKLKELYQRAIEKEIEDPGEYAVKNWIVKLQAFLIHCATSGFSDHYEEIMEGSYRKDLFAETPACAIMKLLGELAYKEVFTSEAIYRMEVAESCILNDLMDKFLKAAIGYDEPEAPEDAMGKRLVSFVSSNYKRAYHRQAEGKTEEEKLYLRLLLATDYICGMTDSYAKRLYQEMKGII